MFDSNSVADPDVWDRSILYEYIHTIITFVFDKGGLKKNNNVVLEKNLKHKNRNRA
jgi:hypothetical protein